MSRPIPGWRWPVVAARAAAIMLLFACALPFQLLLTALGLKTVIPPYFLAATGWLIGLRVRRIGRVVPGRPLLVANHVSWLDIFVVGRVTRTAFVAHSGLAGHRFLKWICEQNETLFVAREQRGSIAGQIGRLRAALARRPIAVFPEATTSSGAGVLPFKSSLLAAVEGANSVPVQPIALRYDDVEQIAWEGYEPGLENLLRILSRVRPIRVTAHVLPPLAAHDRGGRKVMAAAARERIMEALGLSKAGPIA